MLSSPYRDVRSFRISWLYCTYSESVWAKTHNINTVITEICLIHDTNNNRLSRKQAIHLRYSYHISLLCRLKWSSHLLPGLQSVIFHICIARLHHPCCPNCITVTILRDLYVTKVLYDTGSHYFEQNIYDVLWSDTIVGTEVLEEHPA